MERIKFVMEKFGDKYEIYVKECKRFNIKLLQDNEFVIKGDGETYVFILKPKDDT